MIDADRCFVDIGGLVNTLKRLTFSDLQNEALFGDAAVFLDEEDRADPGVTWGGRRAHQCSRQFCVSEVRPPLID